MIRALLLGAASLAVAACATAPGGGHRESDVALPPAFRFAPDPSAAGELRALLPSDDPAFRELSAAALHDAPVLAAALARIDRARAQADRAGAERLPQIDGSLSAQRTRSSAAQVNAPPIPGVSIDRTRTTYGASITARWDADLFGELRARERASLTRIDAAGADAAAVRLALIAEIAAAVADWRTLGAREERLRQDQATADRLVELAAIRERAGIAPGIDRVQAEVISAGTQRSLAALAGERGQVLARLVTLVARPATIVEQALARPATNPVLSPPPTALPSTLLMNRPDVLAAGARLRAANDDVAAAAARRFPKLTLSGALGLLALSVGGLFETDALSSSLVGDLAGPLLDFGRIAADIDQAEAATREAFAEYRNLVFTALGEAEEGFAMVGATDREHAAALLELQAADRAARLSQSRFNAGLSSFVDVLEARRLALAAGERTAAARGRAARARIALWQALGGS